MIFNYNYLKFAECTLYKVFDKSAESSRITKKLKYLRTQSDFEDFVLLNNQNKF